MNVTFKSHNKGVIHFEIHSSHETGSCSGLSSEEPHSVHCLKNEQAHEVHSLEQRGWSISINAHGILWRRPYDDCPWSILRFLRKELNIIWEANKDVKFFELRLQFHPTPVFIA